MGKISAEREFVSLDLVSKLKSPIDGQELNCSVWSVHEYNFVTVPETVSFSGSSHINEPLNTK